MKTWRYNLMSIVIKMHEAMAECLPVCWVTSNSLATRYRFVGNPLARNNDPRSACVSRPTLTRILWHSTSMSNSLATSRMSSMNSSPSSRSARRRRLHMEFRAVDGERHFCKQSIRMIKIWWRNVGLHSEVSNNKATAGAQCSQNKFKTYTQPFHSFVRRMLFWEL